MLSLFSIKHENERNTIVNRCNTIANRYNAIVSRCNAIVSRYNAIVSRYNAIVSQCNGIVSRYNAIAGQKTCVYTVALPRGGETKRNFGGVGFLFLIYARGLIPNP